MALPPGRRLGPYEVIAAIGAGGMGEVYRARDSRLGREVAVKVLPPEVAGDADRLRRFEEEARAAAALNHPSILALYDIGADAGVSFIVTELLDGRTLRQALEDETLSVGRAIDLASQIADGLATAHARGIVHRDIKPENLFVTTDGRAKILDFGLAKSIGAQPAVDTPTRLATAPHTVLGTAGYMSPEQVRGQSADHRADLFAFGAVLYEMVTSRRAFTGDSVPDTMSAILRESPATVVSTPQRAVPPLLTRIIDRCLEKSPAARFQSTTDLAFALKSLSHTDSSPHWPGAPVAAATTPTRWRRALPWTLAGLGVLAAALAWLPARSVEIDSPPTMTFSIEPPAGERFPSSPASPHPAISPDARHLVYAVSAGGGAADLWLRSLESGTGRSLGSGARPFWSPDSRSIAYFLPNRLVVTDRDGAGVRTIAEDVRGSEGSWSPEGVIVFGSAGNVGPLVRVPATGGNPVSITALDAAAGQTGHRHPFFLPGGRRFLYQSVPDNRIWVGSLDGTPPSFLLTADSKAQFAPPGWLLYVKQSTLYAHQFDAEQVELSGEPVRLAEDVRAAPNGRAAFSVSSNGVLVFRQGLQDLQRSLTWLSRGNEPAGDVANSAGRYVSLTISADGQNIVAVVPQDDNGVATDLYSIDAVRGTRTRLTTDPSDDRFPVLSPNGRQVAFFSNRTTPGGIFRKPTSGASPEVAWKDAVCGDDRHATPTDWSTHWLVFHCTRGGPPADLWYVPLDGSAPAKEWLASKSDESFGRLSPDEKFMVYQSNESDQFGVYIRPFPEYGDRKWTVSDRDGGLAPDWHVGKDGALEIQYSRSRREAVVMAVPVRFGAEGPELGSGRVVWATSSANPGPRPAVTRDGQRALVASPVQPNDVSAPLTVLVNWMKWIGER